MTTAESARKHEYASSFRFRPIRLDGTLGEIESRNTVMIDRDQRQRIANAIPDGRRFRVASIEEIERKMEGEG